MATKPCEAVLGRGHRRRAGRLPLLLLAVGWASVLVCNADRAHYYTPIGHQDARNLAIAETLSPRHNFQMFRGLSFHDDGTPVPDVYSRFPVGGFALIKVATMAFGDDLAAKAFAARLLMIAFLCGAMALAHQALARVAGNDWIAAAATLFGFSSPYILGYSNTICTEMMPELFAVMLTLHGMVVFLQEQRFRQLWIKACAALLLGWHPYALLVPFVLLGFGSELAAALRSHRNVWPALLGAGLLGVAFRSRFLRLGLATACWGAVLLAFNFTTEYFALERETPVAQLPSVQSMAKRLGQTGELVGFPNYEWGLYLPRQLYRVGRATLPASVPGLDERLGARFERTGQDPPFTLLLVGVLAGGAALLGCGLARGYRIVFGTLTLSGFFWAILMRGNAYYWGHEFEAIWYVGIPLTLVALVLMPLRRLPNRLVAGLLPGVAAAALLIFVLSSNRMIAQPLDAKTAAHVEAVFADMATIRKMTEGKKVLATEWLGSLDFYGNNDALDWLASGSLIRHLPSGETVNTPEHDFLLVPHHRQETGLVTPENRIVFLYDASVSPASVIRAFVDGIVSSSEPVARASYDLYVNDAELSYVKASCDRDDAQARFSLHVHPVHLRDLPRAAQPFGRDQLDFGLQRHGIVIGGTCAARVPLPRYPIAAIRTGQIDGADVLWEEAFPFPPTYPLTRYRAIFEAAQSTPPNARGMFNLYLDPDDARALLNLTYIKAPCGAADVEAPFFLHVVPARAEDLPEHRREHGFVNLDFEFRLRGRMFDGKCVALAPLPEYPVASIKTGQWVSGHGVAWEATLRL